jgi:hypothetical protein
MKTLKSIAAAYVPENPFRGKNTYSQVALLDQHCQQVQGIGKTKQAALDEAKTYLPELETKTVEETENTSRQDRFKFIFVSDAQAAALEDDPAWEYGALACYAPDAEGVKA